MGVSRLTCILEPGSSLGSTGVSSQQHYFVHSSGCLAGRRQDSIGGDGPTAPYPSSLDGLENYPGAGAFRHTC